jgi:hypothetical protein
MNEGWNAMTTSLLRNALWPFDQICRGVEDLPDHLTEPMRMRNRWRLLELLPFIRRGFVVLGFLGLCLYIADKLPVGNVNLVLHIVLFTAWWFALCFTSFLVWLHSMRPH